MTVPPLKSCAKIGRASRYARLLLMLITAFMPLSSLAQHIGLVGLFPTKALISIDGGTPKTIRLGTTLNGTIKLIAIQNNQATLEVEGKPRVLALGQNLIIKTPNNSQTETVTLTANSYGRFLTTGQVNDISVRFLVDTGATFITMSERDAQRLGLTLSNGQRIYMNSVFGKEPTIKIKLDRVSLNGIVLHNIDAVVREDERPYLLLGMSFLKHLNLHSEGNTMIIKNKTRGNHAKASPKNRAVTPSN